jgi:ABC-type glutathione transport system ATPase component
LSDSNPVLEFQITARYGALTVLDAVSARIQRGQIAALAGLSGSGKSTLALALLRLLQYRGGSVEGSIRLEGEELMGLSESRMRTLRGRRIGYVPQNPVAALNGRLRVRTLLEETWRAHESGSLPAERTQELLANVNLPVDGAFREKRAGDLSTGQGQRLLIALALMHKPALVIADEPTSALDVITQAAVLALLGEINRKLGTAILFISHDLLSVAALAHRVDILHRGKIVESGAPAEIFRAPQHDFTRQLVAAMPRAPQADAAC